MIAWVHVSQRTPWVAGMFASGPAGGAKWPKDGEDLR